MGVDALASSRRSPHNPNKAVVPMKAMSMDEILAAFDPIDRPDVVPPKLTWVAWDDLDYLSWQHPTDRKAYLVTQLPERSVGLVLRMPAGPHRGFCDLCFSIDRDHGTVLAMIDGWTRPRASIGLNICGNLDCSDAVRGMKYVYRMGETISVGRRVERLQENLDAFVRSVTGL